MSPKYLLDTHILYWWLSTPKKLSAIQVRVLGEAERRGEKLALSATTLIELAIMAGVGNRKGLDFGARLLQDLEQHSSFVVLPITFEIAVEVATMGAHLPDPNDRTIVATARVHRLALVTSDERIIKSQLVRVIV